MLFPAKALSRDHFQGLGRVASDTDEGLAAILNSLRGTLVNANQDIYIDPVNGNDGRAEGTEDRPFATWTGMEASGILPYTINGNVNVYIKPGTLRDKIQIARRNINGSLTIKGKAATDPFPTYPFPWRLIFGSMGAVTGVTGVTIGKATSGTKRRLTMAGAGWTPSQLRGKFFLIFNGTNMFTWGHVVDNGADWFDVPGILSTPFDSSSEFVFAQPEVTIRPPDGTYGEPVFAWLNGGAGSVYFEGLRFEMQNYGYLYNLAYLWRNLCNISFEFSSLIGNPYPTFNGANQQVLVSLNQNPGQFSADACDFYVPALKAGSYSGVMWAFGPNGKIQFSSSILGDNLQIYYGCPHVVMSTCSQKYRTGMLEQNVFRTCTYIQILNTYIDANLVTHLLRFDGPNCLDMRYSIIENAPGDGIISYGHHGDLVALYVRDTEVNGCGGHGIHLKGNCKITYLNAKTDPLKKNTGFGLKLRDGSVLHYSGANTLTGLLGDVNLGDGVTPVANGVTATDTTYLTRAAAL